MTNVARIIFSKRFPLAFVVSADLATAENLARAQYQSSIINGEVVSQAPTSAKRADQTYAPEKRKRQLMPWGGFI